MKRPKQSIISKLAAGDPVPTRKPPSTGWPPKGPRSDGSGDAGCVTRSALTTFVDLGMSADEIARYFNVPRRTVAKLLDMWDINAPG